ncbi:MAG TPA: peptidase M14, partial [Rhizobiales bacterium]|nr:peptidase M14 [Hyphomicrobiales bacterium]
ELENRINGDIVIVPQANPIGLSQFPNAQLQGRFDVSSGINFNRDHAKIDLKDRESLLDKLETKPATEQLKNNLLYLALGADIIIDLHCDYESILYAYICKEFWPDANDFAKSLDLGAVFIADGHSSAFEEAVVHAFRHDDNKNPPRRFVSTLELRGQSDVDEKLARSDAQKLFDFLIGRGVVAGHYQAGEKWKGTVTPLDHIEVIKTPVAGTILFNRVLNEEVKEGDLLAKIISKPGQEDGIHEVFAPQDGIIVTRTFNRFAARGDQLYKMTCNGPTKTDRAPGALES